MGGLSRDERIRRTVEVVARRLTPIAPLSRVDARATRLEVQVPALQTSVSPEVIARLIPRSGRLERKLVDDASETMAQWVRNVETAPIEGVQVSHDSWTEGDSGRPHRDLFFIATDEASLRRTFQALPVPADHEVAFGRFFSAENGNEIWRSYHLLRHAEVTGDDITDAEAMFGTEIDRPEVILQFDAAGAGRFEALTARAAGRKLAIVLEGRVNAAPVIESKIVGGRARVTIGGFGDAQALKQEAMDVVAVLRSGGLAAPVRIHRHARRTPFALRVLGENSAPAPTSSNNRCDHTSSPRRGPRGRNFGGDCRPGEPLEAA